MAEALFFPTNSVTVTNAPELDLARDVADEIVVTGEDWFQQYALKQLGFHDGSTSSPPTNGLLGVVRRAFTSDRMAAPSAGTSGRLGKFVRIMVSVCLLMGCVYFAQLCMIFLVDWFLNRNGGSFFPVGGLWTVWIYALIAIVGTVVVYGIVMRLEGRRRRVDVRWTITSRQHGRLVLRKVADPVRV